jgi:hypothetical protein
VLAEANLGRLPETQRLLDRCGGRFGGPVPGASRRPRVSHARSGRDRDFQNPVALIGEEFIGVLDLFQFEAMGHQPG